MGKFYRSITKLVVTLRYLGPNDWFPNYRTLDNLFKFVKFGDYYLNTPAYGIMKISLGRLIIDKPPKNTTRDLSERICVYIYDSYKYKNLASWFYFSTGESNKYTCDLPGFFFPLENDSLLAGGLKFGHLKDIGYPKKIISRTDISNLKDIISIYKQNESFNVDFKCIQQFFSKFQSDADLYFCLFASLKSIPRLSKIGFKHIKLDNKDISETEKNKKKSIKREFVDNLKVFTNEIDVEHRIFKEEKFPNSIEFVKLL